LLLKYHYDGSGLLPDEPGIAGISIFFLNQSYYPNLPENERFSDSYRLAENKRELFLVLAFCKPIR
jgi:hypothetical protein